VLVLASTFRLGCLGTARLLLTRERVLVDVETVLPAVAYQWTTFLGPLLRLSGVMSQYSLLLGQEFPLISFFENLQGISQMLGIHFNV
jgi:hypothetical protein